MSYEEYMKLYMSKDFGKRIPLNIKATEEELSELYKIIDHLINLEQLKTNNMNPETEKVLRENIITQEEKLYTLKRIKEETIQKLVGTQQDIERQEKHVNVLKRDLEIILNPIPSNLRSDFPSASKCYTDNSRLAQAGTQNSMNKPQ